MKFQEWRYVSEDAKNFVRAGLTKNPNMRPTIEQMLEHPWLAEVEVPNDTVVHPKNTV